MRIGLQFAMPSELRALPEICEPFETLSGVPFFEIEPDIIACAGGVGKVNAAMSAEILCLKYGVDLLVNAGVAGCTGDLPTGSLVVPSAFLQHDVDTTAVGDPIGLVSTVNQVEFPTWRPEHCVALLRSLGVDAATGRTATGDWFAVKSSRAAQAPARRYSGLSARKRVLALRISLRQPGARTTGKRSPFRSVSMGASWQLQRPKWFFTIQFSVSIRGRRP